MLDLSFRDWCVLFGVLLKPIKDLPFAIFIARDALSSVSGWIQAVRKGRLHMESWRIECSRQCASGCWDIVAWFCDIPYECTLLTLKSKSPTIRVSR
jgi:hypothetical protein